MTGADLTANIKKHPVGVGSGLIALACGVLLYLHSGDIALSQAENEARSAEANKMITNVRNSANLAEQVTEIQALSKELESRLMRSGQLAVNLQYFYKLEAENEVKLVDVRQAGMNRSNKMQYVTVPFSLTVSGTFTQLVNFLNRLQAGRHFCRVNSATFNKSGGASDTGGEMSLSLNLEVLGQP